MQSSVEVLGFGPHQHPFRPFLGLRSAGAPERPLRKCGQPPALYGDGACSHGWWVDSLPDDHGSLFILYVKVYEMWSLVLRNDFECKFVKPSRGGGRRGWEADLKAWAHTLLPPP